MLGSQLYLMSLKCNTGPKCNKNFSNLSSYGQVKRFFNIFPRQFSFMILPECGVLLLIHVDHISYSRYWTGTSLKRRLVQGNIIKKEMSFAFEETPGISLSSKLVPVQYREYEYGLFMFDQPKFRIRIS